MVGGDSLEKLRGKVRYRYACTNFKFAAAMDEREAILGAWHTMGLCVHVCSVLSAHVLHVAVAVAAVRG